MEQFFENLGLCHIGESILKNLDFRSQLICRLVNKSWRKILEKLLVTKSSKFNLEELQINILHRRGINEWKEFLEELRTKVPIHIVNPYVQHLFASRKMYSDLSVRFFRPLGILAVTGNLKMVEIYLGLNPTDHCSALQLAAKYGRRDIVEYLKRSFSTAITMGVHKSAIYLAASNGNLETLRILMDDLTNPDDAVDDWLFTNASKSGHVKLMKYLEQKLSKKCFKHYLTSKSPVGNTVFHAAAGHGHLEMLKYLCQKAPKNIMQLDTLGNTPTHSAAASGHSEVVRFLTAYTSNPNVTNGLGWTSSRIARSQGFHEIEEFLSNYRVSKKIKL